MAKAEKMKTPWFAQECLLELPDVAAVIDALAVQHAKEALYSEPHEFVLGVTDFD